MSALFGVGSMLVILAMASVDGKPFHEAGPPATLALGDRGSILEDAKVARHRRASEVVRVRPDYEKFVAGSEEEKRGENDDAYFHFLTGDKKDLRTLGSDAGEDDLAKYWQFVSGEGETWRKRNPRSIGEQSRERRSAEKRFARTSQQALLQRPGGLKSALHPSHPAASAGARASARAGATSKRSSDNDEQLSYDQFLTGDFKRDAGDMSWDDFVMGKKSGAEESYEDFLLGKRNSRRSSEEPIDHADFVLGKRA